MPQIQHFITVTEPLDTSQKAEQFLYPPLKAIREGYLPVSSLHTLWFAEYGSPHGIPIVFLHGGPGTGCGPTAMRLFDPAHYHIILFDQRGALRSQPFSEMKENTTQDLIEDLEKLRKHLPIQKWVVVGGSWGSTLALAYGQAYPESCLGFILRGVYLGLKSDLNHLWYGTRTLFPEEWQKLNDFIPEPERNDLIKAYHKRVFSLDTHVREAAINTFIYFDLMLTFSYISPHEVSKIMADEKKMLSSVAKGFLHYAANHFFLEEGQLLNNVARISHLPCIIVHGRYDTLCRVEGAFDLYQKWSNAHLVIISNTGHGSTEPGAVKAMVEASNKLKEILDLSRNKK